MLYRFVRMLIKIVFSILWRPKIFGAQHIDDMNEGAILIANHVHFGDIIAIALATRKTLHFVGKAEIFKNPFIYWLFGLLGAFPITRNSADTKAIRKAISFIREGEIVVIFPEGHRSETGELQNFHKGAAFIAMHCNAPIVPAFIRPKFLRTRLYIDFGYPFDLHSLTEKAPKSERLDTATAIMFKSVADLRDQQALRLNEKK